MMDQPQTPTSETPEQLDIRLHKDIAAFSYIWMMSLVVYFAKKESAFARFHSKQGIVLFLLTIPVSFFPYIGHYLVFLLVAGMLLGFINAAQGHKSDVPFIGPLSRGELKFADVSKSVLEAVHKGVERLKHLRKKHTGPPSTTVPPPATLPHV